MASGHQFAGQAGEKSHARLLKSLFPPKNVDLRPIQGLLLLRQAAALYKQETAV